MENRSKLPATELKRVDSSIDELKQSLQTFCYSKLVIWNFFYMSIIIMCSIAMAHSWLQFEYPTKIYVACAWMFGSAVVILTGRYIINKFFLWMTNCSTQVLENVTSQKTILLNFVKETPIFEVNFFMFCDCA